MKFLKNLNGDTAEDTSISSSSGAASADKIVSTDSSGKLDPTLFPAGYGPDALTFVASESISAGAFVNIYDVSGTPTIRNADANNSAKRAHGYTPAAIASSAQGAVFFDDTNTGLSGLTTGGLFLSASTPGGVTSTAPTGSGKIVQRLGVATSATTVHVNIGPVIILA